MDNEYLSKLEEQKKMREEILRKKEERRFQNVQRMGTNENLNDEKDGKNYAAAFTIRRVDTTVERTQHSNSGDSKKGDRRFQRARAKGPLKPEEKNDLKDINLSGGMRSPFKSSVGPEGKLLGQGSQRKNPEIGAQSSNGEIRFCAIDQDKRRMQMNQSKDPQQNTQFASGRLLTGASEKTGRKKPYLAVVIGTSNKKSPDLERMKLIASTVGPLKVFQTSYVIPELLEILFPTTSYLSFCIVISFLHYCCVKKYCDHYFLD